MAILLNRDTLLSLDIHLNQECFLRNQECFLRNQECFHPSQECFLLSQDLHQILVILLNLVTLPIQTILLNQDSLRCQDIRIPSMDIRRSLAMDIMRHLCLVTCLRPMQIGLP